MLVFAELFLCGYPPRDLLERSSFHNEIHLAVQKVLDVSKKYSETGILFGVPRPTGKNHGKGLFNSALLIHNGKILQQINKSLLPTYDVFDEARYFDPADQIFPIQFKNEILGISICEDAWNDPELWYRPVYNFDPIAKLVEAGARVLINISASPFKLGKAETRFRLIKNHAVKHRRPFVFVNQIGGNDELIFDGCSFAVNRDGKIITQLMSFESSLQTISLNAENPQLEFKPLDKMASIHDALVLGLGDYVKKCGFKSVLVGLSGGIDSAVTCALAVQALGPKKVWGISMPSVYSSPGSIEDSKTLAKNLGIPLRIFSIKDVFKAYIKELSSSFDGREVDITEENIQARIRGNYLMAMSNKFGHLVLSTGNKSEIAMGYCTLYGDMSGGLSVISDLPKTMVYQLALYLNKQKAVIPPATITKAPSAELRPNQTDQDTLPEYEILDSILDHYLQDGYSAAEIIKQGFEKETVYRVIKAVDHNEYKRRQSAPGLKVTSKAFGSGRRIPIAAKFEQSWG